MNTTRTPGVTAEAQPAASSLGWTTDDLRDQHERTAVVTDTDPRTGADLHSASRAAQRGSHPGGAWWAGGAIRRRFAPSAAVLLASLLAACASTQAPASTATPPVPVPAPTASATPAYAALGASETYGVGAEPVTRGYAYQVRDAIGATAGFADLGIPAATLGDAYQTEIAGALALRPTICTVLFGVNDIRAGVSRDAFMANLRDLLTTLHRAKCRTFVIGLPDLAQLPAVVRGHLSGLAATTASWNASMATVAAQTGAAFLSLASFSAEIAAHPEYISADGLHPSTIGHTRLAAVIVDAMRTVGAVH